ncbi:MAG: SDR family oxidoreductase [Anaerolineae bacterium]|nr:SDR family oxidoreductase [Anaerolineae bacterium]
MTLNFADYSLQDRVALVTRETGAQGRAIAAALAQAGARVLSLVGANAGEDQTPAKLVERAIAPVGRLDILVNPHLVPSPTPAEILAPNHFKHDIAANLDDIFFWCQAAAEQMRKQSPAGGCIINISSVGGALALAGQSAFCAAMAGVDAITQTLATEWHPYGIRVVCVGAGLTTELANNGTLQTVLPDGITSGHYRIPPQTRTSENDIARVVTWLASEAGRHINSTTVYTDGGWLADGYWE